MKALRLMDRKLDRIIRAMRNHDMKADGDAAATKPWINFDRVRYVQIEAALEYLREHKGGDPKYFTIARACRETFKRCRTGYPSVEALVAYCYSVPLTDFV